MTYIPFSRLPLGIWEKVAEGRMRALSIAATFLLLTACSNSDLPFSKNLPSAGEAQASVTPPWDALVQATPGAEKDLDLETLNGPEQSQQVVAVPEAPPAPETVATANVKSKPPPPKDAVAIRYVAVPMIKGASGSGNAELTGAMRQVLRDAGWPVLETASPDAIVIVGRVTMAKPLGGGQQVKILWQVTTPKGKKLGEISQENTVPAGSLDSLWGENAGFAAEAAAEGIFKLIQQFR